MKEQYSYTTDELKEVVNELIAWRDGLELSDNPLSKGFIKRIDAILELRKIEDDPVTMEDLG